MDYHKQCLRRQTALRRLLYDQVRFPEAIQIFLSQHAMLHSRQMAQTEPWSFEDVVLDDMPAAKFRHVPPGSEHSPAWLLWHMARCEDITMNLLVAGSPQVLLQGDWRKQMNIEARDTGNAMNLEEVTAFSAGVDIQALRAYRLAVGRRTREVVQLLSPGQITQKVMSSRLQQIWDQGAVMAAAREIVDYWAKRDIGGLLLMPATRHNLIHLNEIQKIKRQKR